MAEQLFRDIVKPTITVGSRSRSTVILSALAHAAAIAAALIVPLVAADRLPAVREMVTFVAPAPAPVPPPPPAPAPARRVDQPQPAQTVDPRVAPVVAPTTIEPERERPVVSREPLNTVEGSGTGLPGGDLVAPTRIEAAPPPPPAPVRTGGDVRMPAKVKDVAPVYPAIAQASRVEGFVIIEATIGTSGAVEDAKVLRGHPLLDEAALAAVRQWRYTPTMLNGVPVPVIVTVTVRFALR